MPVLAELSVADDPDGWRDAGFRVDDDGQCVIGHVRVFLRPQEGRTGVIAWALSDVGEVSTVDGLPTTAPTLDVPEPWAHPNGSTLIDHVVLASPAIDRTQAALEAVGFDTRRVRETESYGDAMQQVFFRAGEVILELVGKPGAAGDGPAHFYGLAVTVADLDTTKALLGDGVSDPKDAVQPGRRIATLRGRSVGVSTAIAFMSE